MDVDLHTVEDIRTASRTMVRELGFMAATLAATRYSTSAVHALLEIDIQGAMTAAQLVKVLGLDKSSVSRMIGKLIEAGELKETASEDDGRAKLLTLTDRGKRLVKKIHAFGRNQVSTALQQLPQGQQQAIRQGLMLYARALRARRLGTAQALRGDIRIDSGYRPGLVGRVTEMHATYYARHAGFGQFFESQVAAGLAEFAGRLDRPANRIWCALDGDRIVGSVSIDGEDLGTGEAHLRWFILDDGYRGSGIGRKLLAEAVAFCDARAVPAIRLWTFKGLEAANRLYTSFGFQLMHEAEGAQWGSVVTEQEFTRHRGRFVV